jgi:hypothetical protein
MGSPPTVERQPSKSGPHRTLLRVTPEGTAAVARWLSEPVERVRDARSLLLLKLLFLHRYELSTGGLLRGQRSRLHDQYEALVAARDPTEGFDRSLVQWRLPNTMAVLAYRRPARRLLAGCGTVGTGAAW